MVALAAVAAVNWNTLNHDAVSYAYLARHYLNGRPDLAVVGTWSPLFVWLLAGCMALVPDPSSAARLAVAVSALVFLAGAALLAGLLPARVARTTMIATSATFAVVASGTLMTPDLLSAGVYATACALVLRGGGAFAAAAGAGFLFGLAFLAKAMLLPVALLVVPGLYLGLALGGRLIWRRAALALGLCLLTATTVAAPWVGLLTAKYGQLTFSTSNRAPNSFMAPPEIRKDHPTNRLFVVPEAGRQSQFEDETELEMAQWSPLDSLRYARHFLTGIVAYNVPVVLRAARAPDLLGIGLVSALAFFARILLRRRGAAIEPIDLALIPIAVPMLGYLATFADQIRYFYLCVPFLYLCGIEGARRLGVVAGRPAGATLLVLATGASFAASALLYAPQMLALTREGERARLMRQLAPLLAEAGYIGPVATAGVNAIKHYGIFLSVHLDMPYHATQASATTADGLEHSCARLIFAGQETAHAQTMATAPERFVDLRASLPAADRALAGTGMRLYWVSRDPKSVPLCEPRPVRWRYPVFAGR